MLAKSNLTNQTKRIFNFLSKKFTSIQYKNRFNTFNLISFNNNRSFLIYAGSTKFFSTGNKINEKESIDFVESKIFEVLIGQEMGPAQTPPLPGSGI